MFVSKIHSIYVCSQNSLYIICLNPFRLGGIVTNACLKTPVRRRLSVRLASNRRVILFSRHADVQFFRANASFKIPLLPRYNMVGVIMRFQCREFFGDSSTIVQGLHSLAGGADEILKCENLDV
jgi:hypothetical protein